MCVHVCVCVCVWIWMYVNNCYKMTGRRLIVCLVHRYSRIFSRICLATLQKKFSCF